MNLSIEAAARILREGGVVAFPTETVYGLGANALDASAVARVYLLKERPASSPLIVHVVSKEMARQVVAEWPPRAEELASQWWPGPLTLVLPKRPHIPDIVTAGLPTVGVRMPAHPLALELIRAAGVPLAAPSANKFTGISPTTADHVRAAFGSAVPVLDGGPCKVGIESTIVAIDGDRLTLLRPGMVEVEARQPAPEPSGAHPAPGLHPRHYSPRTPLRLIAGRAELPDDRGAYLWITEPGPAVRSVQMPADPEAYAARLYAALHECDALGLPWIAVQSPPATPEWAAIHDRLRRAAGTVE